MAFLILAAAALILIEFLSMRVRPGKIKYELSLDRALAEQDEEILLITTLENGRRLPIFYLKATLNAPNGLLIREGGAGRTGVFEDGGDRGVSRLTDSFYLMGHERLTRSTPVFFRKRGRYRFQSAMLTTGDFAGLKESQSRRDFYRQVIVIPKKLELPALEFSLKNYLGDRSVRRFILEDPVLVTGFRDYTGREPMRDVSWTATARRNQLMVKEYDHTSEISAEVILNVEGGSEEETEKAFSAARTVIDLLEKKRVPCSFRTNAVITGAAGAWTYIPEGLGREHRNTIVSGLGSALCLARDSFQTLLLNAAAASPVTGSSILVTVPLAPEARLVLQRMKASGQTFFMIEGESIHGCN